MRLSRAAFDASKAVRYFGGMGSASGLGCPCAAAVIAAAGPLSNILMAVAGAAIFATLPDIRPGDIAGGAVMRPLETLVLQFIQLNVLLAVFNMIPVPPLDGGNVLLGVLPHAGARLVEQLRPYGFLILYALMLTGVLNTVVFPVAFAILRVLLGLP